MPQTVRQRPVRQKSKNVEEEEKEPLQSSDETSTVKSNGLGRIVIAGIVLRVVCYFFLSDYIPVRPELDSPLTSFNRLKDGIAMANDSISPYLGDSFHFQPVLLHVFTWLMYAGETSIFLMLVALDVLAALMLRDCTIHFVGGECKALPSVTRTVVKSFLWNPIAIAACASLNLSVLYNFVIVVFIYSFSRGSKIGSSLALSAATHFSLYPAVAFFVVLTRFPKWSDRLITMVVFAVSLSLWTILSFVLTNSWEATFNTYHFLLTIEDLTPNCGIYWYFFTQVFDHFREFYLYIFQLGLLMYALPLMLSLRRDVYLHLIITLLLITIMQSYPSLNDATIYLALLPTMARYSKHFRFALLIGCTIVSCVVLMPIMRHMWLISGSGNANFYFAVTLIYNLAQIYLLMDLLFAYFRIEAEDICGDFINAKTKLFLY